jgi:hypothetical protein
MLSLSLEKNAILNGITVAEYSNTNINSIYHVFVYHAKGLNIRWSSLKFNLSSASINKCFFISGIIISHTFWIPLFSISNSFALVPYKFTLYHIFSSLKHSIITFLVLFHFDCTTGPHLYGSINVFL